MDETAGQSGTGIPPVGATRWVTMGTCGAPYGVKGWLRVGSFTEPRPAIFELQPWWVEVRGERRAFKVEYWRESGRHLLAKLEGFENPESVTAIKGAAIEVERDCLPAPAVDEYYWCDLLGLEVRTLDGEFLGLVSELFETGSNDVMVVGPERHLVPFVVGQVVEEVDFENGAIRVDWDLSY